MVLIGNIVQKLIATTATTCCRHAPNSSLNLTQVRTAVIYNLPRVSEVKRVRKQGYKTRVKTEIGRKFIMTRILKGDKTVSQ